MRQPGRTDFEIDCLMWLSPTGRVRRDAAFFRSSFSSHPCCPPQVDIIGTLIQRFGGEEIIDSPIHESLYSADERSGEFFDFHIPLPNGGKDPTSIVGFERPTRAVELGVGHSGTRNSSRKEIPSSGKLALTNKERIVGLVGQFRLAPPYYSCPVARTNQRISKFAGKQNAL